MRKGFGKLGFIALGLVLALALCGIGYAHWSETLNIEGTIITGEWDHGGTIGFWKNWDKHKTFEEDDIGDWLTIIDADSDWLVPDMDGDGDIDIEDMEAILGQVCGNDMEYKFLKQYLATRLNVKSGLLSPGDTHDFHDPGNYLGLNGSGTLPDIIAAIEGKYGTSPDKDQFEIMKDICDDLNNTGGIYPHH